MNAAGRQSNGIIKISDEVIAVCAANATLKTKGVADLAGGISNALSKNFLGKELTWKGIKVSQSEDGVELDVHIIVKYHAKIPAVAWDIPVSYTHLDVYKRQERERLEEEGILYAQLLSEKNTLEKQLTESKNTLKQLYDDADIEPAYRNLVAIGYMYELISIEAATQLKGSNGLYYLVRKELRQDNLEGILNGISDQLNTIISQNNRLHNELMLMNQESVRLSGKILSELKETSKTQMEMNNSMRAIERNTRYSSYSNALTSYNTTRMRKELEYQAFLKRVR